MGLYNNVPTFTYVSATGVTVTYNDKIYTIQSFYTNKKYIYWDSDNATVLQASNTMPTRSTKTHLVIINDNGVATTVPSTSDNFSISYDGDSNESIKSRIYALYEKNKDLGDKYIAIEQDIEGIKQIVGSSEESQGSLIDRVSKIEQTSNNLELSINTIEREYSDDKELTRLREDLNSSIIILNSGLGTLNSELQSYYKDDAISSEEITSIEALLDEVVKSKLNLSSCLDRVLVITEKIGNSTNLLALNNAIKALDNSHENLTRNINIAIGDYIITPSEKTILIDAFAKYSLRITELKNVCDNIIFLGVGGVMVDELSKISVKSDEIRLSVSKTENNLRSDINLQKVELKGQINDVTNSLSNFKDTVNTVFKDSVIDESEKLLLKEKISNIDKEKLDIDSRYDSIVNNVNLSDNLKENLIDKYNQYNLKHNELKTKIQSVISDNIVNDAEKLEVETTFKEYANTLSNISTFIIQVIEDISFNASVAELKKAKDELKDEINEVKGSIDGIDEFISGTFENNILDETERQNIEQNLETLSREKIDIDKTYTELYGNIYLTGQTKANLKSSYDNYISKYEDVVRVLNGILEKEELINDVDRANMNSAIAKHKESLSLFSTQANKSIDVIATNKVDSAKNELSNNINNVKNDIGGLSSYIDGAFKDGILSDSEKNSIKQNLKTLETSKLNIDKQYDVVYNNKSLAGTVKTDLQSSYNNYISKYNSLVSVINNILDKTGLLVESDNTNLNAAFKEHNAAMSLYNEKINIAIDYISTKNIENAKSELSNNINELSGALNNLEDTMYGAFQDSILTESEKLSVNQHLLSLSAEKSDIDKQYATIYSNTYLNGDVKTNLKTSYDNYIASYNFLVVIVNNILNKQGLIDSTDRNELNDAFKNHNSKLGLYTESATNALDYIAERKVAESEDKLSKQISEIVIDKDSIKSTVSDLSGKYTQIKQTVDSIDLSGKVSFSDLSTSGKTTINGGNITTGTINASKAKITNINASNINTGSLSASLITAGTLDASKITVKNLSASSITSGTLSGDRISGGTISATNEINFNGGARIFGNTGAYDAGLTISAQVYNFNSGDASFQSSVSVCGGSLKLNRGSMYIPIYSGNETLDYIQGGNCKLGFTNYTDSNAIYFTLGSEGGGLLAHATINLAHNGNTLCNFMRLGKGIIASPSSGSFHFVDTYGNASPLYTGRIWELRYYSEDEAQELSDDSVFDDINSINVINTKEGLGLINPTLSANDDDNNYTVKTSYNEEKERLETSINHTSAISTLWKAVQELKSENEELKSLCKKMNEEIITLKKC